MVRRIDTKLEEVVGRTLMYGDREECHITIVPPFAFG